MLLIVGYYRFCADKNYNLLKMSSILHCYYLRRKPVRIEVEYPFEEMRTMHDLLDFEVESLQVHYTIRLLSSLLLKGDSRSQLQWQ